MMMWRPKLTSELCEIEPSNSTLFSVQFSKTLSPLTMQYLAR